MRRASQTYKSLDGLEQLLDDHGDALVAQQAAHGPEVRGADEAVVQAEDGGE